MARRVILIVVLGVLVTAVAATPGSSASFNDSAPCPASGPLLVYPTMHVSTAVHLQLLAQNGCDVYWWEIVNGGLPAGLSMSSGGLVSGTPTAAGTTQPWVWAHDLTTTQGGPSWCGGDNYSERQFVFTVVGSGGGRRLPGPHLHPLRSRPCRSRRAAWPSGGSMTWTVSSGSLPGGLSLSSNGVVSGTPTAAGSFTFTVRVDSGGRSASKQFQLVVAERLAASAPAAQTWEVSRPLQISIDAKGGSPGYSWKISGTLPLHTGFVGDKGNGSTSFVQGVPGEAGTFPIVLTVTDTAGATPQVNVTLTVAPKLQIKTFAIGRARVGRRYGLGLQFAGGVGATQWSLAAGSLPSGLSLDATTAVVSGKAPRVGRFRFTVTAADTLGAKAAMTYSLVVRRR